MAIAGLTKAKEVPMINGSLLPMGPIPLAWISVVRPEANRAHETRNDVSDIFNPSAPATTSGTATIPLKHAKIAWNARIKVCFIGGLSSSLILRSDFFGALVVCNLIPPLNL